MANVGNRFDELVNFASASDLPMGLHGEGGIELDRRWWVVDLYYSIG